MFAVQSVPIAHLNAVAWVLVAALVAYLVAFAPIQGRRAYRRLVAERGTDPQALLRFYRRNVARKWLLLIPVILIIVISPHAGLRNLGFAQPSAGSGRAWRMFVELTVVIVVSSLFYRSIARRGGRIPGQGLFRALIPQTGGELRWAVAVATTAGITEEVLFRGLILNAGIWAGLTIASALTVSSLLFGVIHIYQGARGVVLTTLIGFLFGWFYLATLSLVLPVVLHILLDLRALVWVRPALSDAPPAPPPVTEDDRRQPLVRRSSPTD